MRLLVAVCGWWCWFPDVERDEAKRTIQGREGKLGPFIWSSGPELARTPHPGIPVERNSVSARLNVLVCVFYLCYVFWYFMIVFSGKLVHLFYPRLTVPSSIPQMPRTTILLTIVHHPHQFGGSSKVNNLLASRLSQGHPVSVRRKIPFTNNEQDSLNQLLTSWAWDGLVEKCDKCQRFFAESCLRAHIPNCRNYIFYVYRRSYW